jgi:hypothetical protein
MLPNDWRKEIDEAVSKATSATADAENHSHAENQRIAASIDALTHQLERYNAEQEREAPKKRRREKWTIVALTAAAVFTLALAGFSAWQVVETRRAYEPIKTAADAAVQSATAASASAVAGQKTAETAAKNVDVLINSERARLLFGSMKLIKNGEIDPTPHIDYTWINFGRGPAIINDLLVDCQLVGTIPAFPLENSPKVKHGQFTLGSGATGGTSGLPDPLAPCTLDTPLTPDDWASIGNSTKSILFQGFIRYEDAFHRYRWHFGGLYWGNVKFFSTAGLPPAYNEETQEDQPK